MAKKENKTKKEKKHFFKDFKAELKRVIWPTPKQLVKSTSAVIFIVIVTAATIARTTICHTITIRRQTATVIIRAMN